MSKVVGEYAVHGILDDDGASHTFLPGTEVPAWAAKQMGAHCFEGGEDVFNEAGVQRPVLHHDAVLPAAAPDGGPPPKAGKGSGEDKWRAYADAKGLDVSEIDGRDEIIAALEAEGVPVE